MTRIATLTLILFALGAHPIAKAAAPSELEVADTYYSAFLGEGTVSDIPMRSDLTFASPRFTLTSAAAFRDALSELFGGVRSLEIESQLHQEGTVLTFYLLDLGAPDGAIPMAERLHIENGEIAAVDLIFDSARLPGPASTECD